MVSIHFSWQTIVILFENTNKYSFFILLIFVPLFLSENQNERFLIQKKAKGKSRLNTQNIEKKHEKHVFWEEKDRKKALKKSPLLGPNVKILSLSNPHTVNWFGFISLANRMKIPSAFRNIFKTRNEKLKLKHVVLYSTLEW